MYCNVHLWTERTERQTSVAGWASVSTGAGRHADRRLLVGRNNATKCPETAQISTGVNIEDLEQAPPVAGATLASE
jgi:hypothetical protein